MKTIVNSFKPVITQPLFLMPLILVLMGFGLWADFKLSPPNFYGRGRATVEGRYIKVTVRSETRVCVYNLQTGRMLYTLYQRRQPDGTSEVVSCHSFHYKGVPFKLASRDQVALYERFAIPDRI